MSHLSNKSSHFNQLETRMSISHQNLSSISKCTWNSLWTPANDNKYVITYVIIKVAGYHHVSCASQDSTQEHNHQVTKWSVSNAPCILLYMALLYLWAGFLLQFCPKNFRSFERVITDHQSQAIWEVAKIYTMQLILLRLDEKALRKSWPGCNLLFEWKWNAYKHIECMVTLKPVIYTRYKFLLSIHLLKLHWNGQNSSQITPSSNCHWSAEQSVPGGSS